jgi:hypothetical protein
LTNLRKHRLFKRNPDLLPKAVVDQLSATSPSETTSESAQTLKKIENRLCSSKAAAEEVRKAVAWLVGEEGAKLGGPGKKVPAPIATPSRGKTGASKLKPAAEAEEDEDEDEGDVSISRNMVVGSDDEEDGSDFDQDEVAADDAGWESGSVSGDDLAIPRTSVSASRARFADESGSEDDDAISIAPTPKKSKTKAQPKAKAEPNKKALTSSTFLPSLSTGFTRGGSDDSDPDDDTGFGLEDVIGKGRIGERKNRRGQRARQLYALPIYPRTEMGLTNAGSGSENTARTLNISRRLANKRQRAISQTPTASARPLPLHPVGQRRSRQLRLEQGRDLRDGKYPRINHRLADRLLPLDHHTVLPRQGPPHQQRQRQRAGLGLELLVFIHLGRLQG